MAAADAPLAVQPDDAILEIWLGDIDCAAIPQGATVLVAGVGENCGTPEGYDETEDWGSNWVAKLHKVDGDGRAVVSYKGWRKKIAIPQKHIVYVYPPNTPKDSPPGGDFAEKVCCARAFGGGPLLLLIKWVGYHNKARHFTWQPCDSLGCEEGASVLELCEVIARGEQLDLSDHGVVRVVDGHRRSFVVDLEDEAEGLDAGSSIELLLPRSGAMHKCTVVALDPSDVGQLGSDGGRVAAAPQGADREGGADSEDGSQGGDPPDQARGVGVLGDKSEDDEGGLGAMPSAPIKPPGLKAVPNRPIMVRVGTHSTAEASDAHLMRVEGDEEGDLRGFEWIKWPSRKDPELVRCEMISEIDMQGGRSIRRARTKPAESSTAGDPVGSATSDSMAGLASSTEAKRNVDDIDTSQEQPKKKKKAKSTLKTNRAAAEVRLAAAVGDNVPASGAASLRDLPSTPCNSVPIAVGEIFTLPRQTFASPIDGEAVAMAMGQLGGDDQGATSSKMAMAGSAAGSVAQEATPAAEEGEKRRSKRKRDLETEAEDDGGARHSKRDRKLSLQAEEVRINEALATAMTAPKPAAKKPAAKKTSSKFAVVQQPAAGSVAQGRKPQPLQAGESVVAKYRGRGNRWYSGTIRAVVPPGNRFDIDYDDGDNDRALPAAFIRRLDGQPHELMEVEAPEEVKEKSDGEEAYVDAPPLTGIPNDDIGSTDFLLGRGHHQNKNSGNEDFLKFVAHRKSDYEACSGLLDPKKGEICEEVVKQWRAKGGRFLKKNNTGTWDDVGNDEAQKVVQKKLGKKADAGRKPPAADALPLLAADAAECRKKAEIALALATKELQSLSKCSDDDGEDWTCGCGNVLSSRSKRCGKCNKWKGGKRDKPTEKDPNAPKRPLGPFFLFQNEMRPQLKEAHPAGEVAKIMSKRWKKLSDEAKQSYKDRYEEKKKAYEVELAAYEASKPEAEAVAAAPNEPKRPQDTFRMWCAEVGCAEVKTNHPDFSLGEMSTELSKRYKAMSEEEKTKWTAKADEAKEKYKIELAEYEKTKPSCGWGANGISLSKHKRWLERFVELCNFARENGHCRVPSGAALGPWLSIQRSLMKDGSIDEYRRLRLESIGVKPSKKDWSEEEDRTIAWRMGLLRTGIRLGGNNNQLAGIDFSIVVACDVLKDRTPAAARIRWSHTILPRLRDDVPFLMAPFAALEVLGFPECALDIKLPAIDAGGKEETKLPVMDDEDDDDGNALTAQMSGIPVAIPVSDAMQGSAIATAIPVNSAATSELADAALVEATHAERRLNANEGPSTERRSNANEGQPMEQSNDGGARDRGAGVGLAHAIVPFPESDQFTLGQAQTTQIGLLKMDDSQIEEMRQRLANQGKDAQNRATSEHPEVMALQTHSVESLKASIAVANEWPEADRRQLYTLCLCSTTSARSTNWSKIAELLGRGRDVPSCKRAWNNRRGSANNRKILAEVATQLFEPFCKRTIKLHLEAMSRQRQIEEKDKAALALWWENAALAVALQDEEEDEEEEGSENGEEQIMENGEESVEYDGESNAFVVPALPEPDNSALLDADTMQQPPYGGVSQLAGASPFAPGNVAELFANSANYSDIEDTLNIESGAPSYEEV